MSTSSPPAERLDLVEELHGHPVADPYRWLEDPEDPRTKAWSAAQDELARTALDALPGRAALADRLRGYLSAGSVSVPLWRAGRAFFSRRAPGQDFAVVYVREADGSERPLLDPIAWDAGGRTTLDTWVPDLEGAKVAYQVSHGGDEQSVLFVLDVASGEIVEGPIDRCRYSSVAWLPGGEEFFYVRKVAPGEMPPGEEDFHRRVWRHRVGSAEDVLVEAPGLYTDHTYYGVRVSRDGRWLVVSANVGTARRDSVWVGEVGGPLVPVLTQADDVQATCWVERDARLYVHTTDGAPRGRLAVADPAAPQREHWRELVPEDPGSVLQGVRYLEPGTLVLARSRHAVAELTLHALDGTPTGEIPLPGTGSLTGLTVADRDTPQEGGKVWIGWTDLVTPPQVHRYERGRTVLESTAPGQVELPAVRSELREFTSADGTTVRMFTVTPDSDGPFPTLVTGYGGFALAREPAYTSSALAWVAAGGAYVLVGLRGGSEEGEAWHLAGNRAHKQNVFDDLHAACTTLLADGTASRIAIQGGSNGGLLVGAALTQRPELYAAVACSAPLLDMVRYERFSLGRTWNDEYGTADDPVEFGWLLGYSPYHHVHEGTAYPPTLFTVFDSDTRVDPLHARKMCAALQHATTGGPVLLRRESDVGHGARSISRTVALSVDTLAFLAHHTGLELTMSERASESSAQRLRAQPNPPGPAERSEDEQ
ncbi:prolyl oligopeptidase family serine peptidase [Pseudonocardia oroxyli]|uniref:prolyl oligopeptidase n=1 Tax=Pseudonocardia oroxyli TaxID=366584 RepID=A0A1G7WEC6_PSEOR|nr:prolyl oligopeptidase family serine peptidase [Pseudonocardia oroxyli]SDG70332.1 prolyl oligopeptidase [Pseudonocardia oroxyli]